MPRLTYSPDEAHLLLTARDAVADTEPELAAVYDVLAVNGVDLDSCTSDEDLRARLGMPPLDDQDGQGQHPHVA